MKVLITGGAGYIGTILTEELLKLEYIKAVYVIDNLMYKQDGIKVFCSKEKYKFIYGDVRNKNIVKEYLNIVDIVIPLAALVGFPACEKNRDLATQINYEQIKYIAGTFKGYILYPNTNSGYGTSDGKNYCDESTKLTPITHYGITKCEAEKIILDTGNTALRLATVFGTSYRFRKDLMVNDFTLKAVQDKYIVLYEHNFKRNFIHIRDVANVMIHLITNEICDLEGEAFNVGLSSANMSKLELCELIKKFVPSFDIKLSNFSSDPDKRNYIVSNDKIHKTGWRPIYSVESGIKELIKCYEVINNTSTNYTNL